MRFKILLIILSMFINVISIYSSEQKDQKITLPIIYLSDFDGRFIDLNPDSKHSYIDILKQIDYYKSVLPLIKSDKNYQDPITLSNGASFWPDSSVKYMLDQPSGSKFIASLLKFSNFKVINLGKRDLYTPISIMDQLSKNGEIKKLPFMVSNLKCLNKKHPICKIVKNKQYRIIKSGDIKVAILSIIDPSTLEKTNLKTREALKFEDPIEVVNRLTKKLKKEKKVDIIILLSQFESRETTPKKTLKLATEIKDVDILIGNNLNIRTIRKFDKKVYITGLPSGRFNTGLLLLDIKKGKDGYKLDDIESFIPVETKSTNKLLKNLNQVLNRYKEAYLKKFNKPLNGMKVEKPISFDQFVEYILNILRDTTSSEIAFINRENFIESIFPMKKLTHDFIKRGILYNDPVYTFYMKGKEIKDFLKKHGKNRNLISVGIKKDKINGRKIIDKKLYKVVSTRFIVNGGDEYFINNFHIDQKFKHKKLKSMVLSFFKKPQFQKVSKDNIWDPKKQFIDISEKFLLEFLAKSTISFIQSELENGENYGDSNLVRTPVTSLNVDIDLSLLASSKYHILDNSFMINYYLMNENNTEYQESKDLVTYRFNYKNLYFKSANGSFFTPLPYFETKLETEFDKAEGADYHHFTLDLSVGGSFLTLDQKFELKLGLTMSKELLYNETIQYGISFGYNFKPYDITFLKIPVKFESKLDHFIAFTDKKVERGTFMGKTYIPLLGFFYLNFKFNAFIYREESLDYAYTYDMTFGVSILLNKWIQML